MFDGKMLARKPVEKLKIFVQDFVTIKTDVLAHSLFLSVSQKRPIIGLNVLDYTNPTYLARRHSSPA